MSASTTVNTPLADSPEYQAFREFAELTGEKRDLAARQKEIDDALDALRPALLSYLSSGCYEKVQVAGFTISTREEVWPKPLEGQGAFIIQALKDCGLKRFIREDWNRKSLGHHLAELEEHHRLLSEGGYPVAPPAVLVELRKYLKLVPSYTLVVHDRRRNQDPTGGFHV